MLIVAVGNNRLINKGVDCINLRNDVVKWRHMSYKGFNYNIVISITSPRFLFNDGPEKKTVVMTRTVQKQEKFPTLNFIL